MRMCQHRDERANRFYASSRASKVPRLMGCCVQQVREIEYFMAGSGGNLEMIVSALRAVARKALPISLRRFLVRSYLRQEAAFRRSLEQRFKARPIPLSSFHPIFERAPFSRGPIVLVNSALAAGGVERQSLTPCRFWDDIPIAVWGCCAYALVKSHTWISSSRRLRSSPALCATPCRSQRAKRALESIFPKSTNKNLHQAISWMPSDVQEEILRLAAEFATLKPFVVHAWQDSTGIAATYAARMIGVPRVMISTRNVRPTNFAWYRPYMYHAHGEIARCSDVVMINNSEAGATDYAQWLDIPSDRFVVKRNGLDTTTIHRPSPSIRCRFAHPTWYSCGRHGGWFNIQIL